MDYLKDLGSLALASRMKRLVDRFRSDVKMIYKENKADFEPALMPLFSLVTKHRELSIQQAADYLGISQPAVTQFYNALKKKGLVDSSPGSKDQRKKVIKATPDAPSKLMELQPVWEAMDDAVVEMMADTNIDLLAAIDEFEAVYAKESFRDRVSHLLKQRNSPDLTVVPFSHKLSRHFKALNEPWIREHFYMEDYDHRVLEDPQSAIIEEGGQIFFAKCKEQIVGTFALIKVSGDVYELGKMAVSTEYRKMGVGSYLVEYAIQQSRIMGINKLVLYSNTKLATAINLYFKHGFRVVQLTEQHNERANIKMEIRL